MTPTQLESLGKLVYGDDWKSPMSRDLGIAYRTMLRWANGERAMPDGLVTRIRKVAKRRAASAIARARELERVAGE